MNQRIAKCLAVMLAAWLLAALLPAVLAEDAAVQIGEAGAPVALGEEALEPGGAVEWGTADGETVVDGTVDPQAGLAADAGDTGLSIEYEEPAPEDQPGAEEFPEEIDLPAYEDEAGPEAEDVEGLPEDYGDGAEIPAVQQARVGYAAVAPETLVYADAGLTQAMGQFPEGAVVYTLSVEDGGALLRVRFDTQSARDWGEALPEGYVAAGDTLAYTQEETAALIQALSGDVRARWADGLPVPCSAFSALEYAVAANETVMGLYVDAHTQAEIQAFVDAHPAYRNQINIYSVAATDEPYTIGTLSPVNQQSALNMINQIRYIAGLNADVTLNYDREYSMAAASLVNRLNGALSHYPLRPAALADAAYDGLYNQGYTGAGSANIAMGYTATSSILAYMADADEKNMTIVGHRRWIINPQLGRTIMGANGRFSAMYAHDFTGTGRQTKVAWPAQEMPFQYFAAGDPWSLSYGRELDAAQVQVDLVRLRDGRTWHFSQAQADGYFNVENSYYGLRGCVIFKPDGLDSIAEGDLFNVSVTDGAGGEITRYAVHFFSLDLSAATPSDALSVTAVKTGNGNAVSWSAVSGVTGYYVCRRNENSNYQIIADVADATEYFDSAVFDDLTYYYQVYAHTASVTSRSAISVQATYPVPDSVTLNYEGTVTLYAGSAVQLYASVQPSYAQTALAWDSSYSRVATVDVNGLVTAVNEGSTIVSVRTDNGKQASIRVNVVGTAQKPSSVALNYSGTVKLNVNDQLQLNAALSPEGASSSLKWSSSRKSVAKVSGAGLVTAKKAGTAVITVKTANGKKDTVKIKVTDPYTPKKVTLDRSGTVKLNIADQLQLNATLSPATAQTKLKWSSSNKKVARVNSSGVVTPVKAGTVKITVKTANGRKDTVKIKVVDPYAPKKVKLAEGKKVTLKVGQTLQLNAVLSPDTAQTTLKWKSSKKSVAKVSSGGLITARKKGTAKITVTTKNGKKATITVKVTK